MKKNVTMLNMKVPTRSFKIEEAKPPIGLQCLSKFLSIIRDLQFLSQSLIELVAENQNE